MIYAISGNTGSQKTFQTVKRFILPEWKKGRTIYTTILLLFYTAQVWTWYERLWHWLLKKPYKKGKIILFNSIDEILGVRDSVIFFDDAGKFFNNKNWESISLDFVYKLFMNRHDRNDFIATTPKIKTIHIDYRRTCHKWFHFTPLLIIGHDKRARKFLVWSKMQEMNIDDIEGDDEKIATPALNFIGRPKKGHWRFVHYWSKVLYDTHAIINFKFYKVIWIVDKYKKQAWIIPITMSLSSVMSKYASLKKALKTTK